MAPQGKDGERPLIIVKKYKRVGGGHHGGAWKVAYADFVTAMMAFFLVMWLVTAVSKEQRAAIFDYFKNPSMEPGKSVKPAPGLIGPGGASTSPIDLRGGLDAPKTTNSAVPGIGSEQQDLITAMQDPQAAEALREKEEKENEKKRLESLMDELKEAISKSQALEPFKDQLLLDITPEGLRIQIIDAQNRPMFDIGSARLKNYTDAILRELTPYLNSVPNRVSLTGHTDQTPYGSVTGYTNWDLSSDRANSARRALEASGLDQGKVARIVGLSSSVLFDKQNPRSPVNRRISIIVMTRDAEEEAMRIEVPTSSEANIAATADTGTPAKGPAASATTHADTSATATPATTPMVPPAPAPAPANASATKPPSAAASAARASMNAVVDAAKAAVATPANTAPAKKPTSAPTKAPAAAPAKPPPPAATPPAAAPMYPIPSARN